jgi:subtilase family serine protease
VDTWLGNERPDLAMRNLTIYRADNETIDGVKKRPIMGQETFIKVVVNNQGTEDINDIDVVFLDDDVIFGEQSISLDTGEQIEVCLIWIPQFEGEHRLDIVVDYQDKLKEINETNNKITETIDVKSVLPLYFFKVMGKVMDEGGNNIRGAKVTIKNLRTGETINATSDKYGYEVTLETDWYQEGDTIEVKASYESASSKKTFTIFSEDRQKECNFTLETEDWLIILKFFLMLFEIFGFYLVFRYYANIRKLKKNTR